MASLTDFSPETVAMIAVCVAEKIAKFASVADYDAAYPAYSAAQNLRNAAFDALSTAISAIGNNVRIADDLTQADIAAGLSRDQFTVATNNAIALAFSLTNAVNQARAAFDVAVLNFNIEKANLSGLGAISAAHFGYYTQLLKFTQNAVFYEMIYGATAGPGWANPDIYGPFTAYLFKQIKMDDPEHPITGTDGKRYFNSINL